MPQCRPDCTTFTGIAALNIENHRQLANDISESCMHRVMQMVTGYHKIAEVTA